MRIDLLAESLGTFSVPPPRTAPVPAPRTLLSPQQYTLYFVAVLCFPAPRR